MSRKKKLMLGVVTFWPPLYMCIFMSFFFIEFVFVGSGHPDLAGASFIVLFAMHAFTILMMLCLMVYYVLHALDNENLDDKSNKRLLWVLILFFGNMIAMPIYFYRYIWKTPPAPDGAQQ